MTAEIIDVLNTIPQRHNLLEYQRRIVDHIKDNPKCGVFVDMGMGKTISTLTATADLVSQGKITGHILVIAPLRVARHVWFDEMNKWCYALRRQGKNCWDYTPLTGSQSGRESNMEMVLEEEGPYFCTINRENVAWLCKYLEDVDQPWPFQMTIIDESQSFKDSSTKRWKALRRHIHKSERVVLLTGTPISNGLQDIWAQMYLLDQGERLGKTFTPFTQRFFYRENNGPWAKWPGKLVQKEGAREQVKELIKDICISITAKEWFNDKNDVVHNTVYVTLSDKEMQLYKKLDRQSFLEFEEGKAKAGTAGILANKLLQAASGSVYLDEGGWGSIHEKKTEALAEMLEGLDNNVIIVYNFVKDKERILQVLERTKQKYACFGDERAKSGNIIDQWNRGELKYLVMHPQSAGHGLNLQYGGSNLIWYTLPWSLEQYSQTNARITGGHRGVGKISIIHRIVAAGTYDEEVCDILANKNCDKQDLMDSLTMWRQHNE